MAHQITNASLDGIQNRLANVAASHPFEADTFMDWTVEAGDIISAVRGSTSYTSPVHSTKMVWKGGLTSMTVSSTGTKERDPVAKVSRQKYGRGGSAVRSQEHIYYEFNSEDGILHSTVSASAHDLTIAYQNADSQLDTKINVTAAGLRADFEDADRGLSTRITANANGLSAEAQARSDNDAILEGQLVVQADMTGLVVSSTDDREVKVYDYESAFPRPGSAAYLYLDRHTMKYYEWNGSNYVETTPHQINRAGIISTINQDGSSTTHILGDKVIISELDDEDLDTWAADAKNGTGVFTKFLTVRRLNAQEINTMLLNVNNELVVDGGVKASVGFFSDEGVVNVGGGITGSWVDVSHVYIDNEFEINLLDASIDNNNTLSIYKVEGGTVTIKKSDDGSSLIFTDPDGGSFTFNKATSKVRGTWSGDTLEISAYQYGQELPYTSQISTRFYASSTTGTYKYYVGSYRKDNDAQQASLIENTEQQIQLGVLANSPTIVRVLNAAGTTFINDTPTYTVQLENRTGANKIDHNGTFTASPGYIGFGQIEVDVSGTITQDVKTRFNANSGQYYIEAFDNQTQNPILGSSVTYKLALNAAGTKVQIQNTSGTQISSTPEYTLPVINVVAGTWHTSKQSEDPTTTDDATITFSPSEGNGTSYTQAVRIGIVSDASFPTSPSGYIRINAYDENDVRTIAADRRYVLWAEGWSGNNNAVHLGLGASAASANYGTLTIDGTPRYNAGWNGARSLVVSNLPTADIGAVVDGTYKTISIKYPGSNGNSTLSSADYTLSLNGEFQPQTGSKIKTVELKYNSAVVARISANSFYNDGVATGHADGLPASGTASGRSGSSYNWVFAIKSVDNTTTNLTINASAIYSDARQGYYTQAQYTEYGTEQRTAGQNDVTLSGPTWSKTTGTSAGTDNTATVSTSGRPTALSRNVPVALSVSAWSSNKKTVDITTTNGTIVARTTVDASTIYADGITAGKAAVTLADPVWKNGAPYTAGVENKVTVSTSGRTSELSKEIPVTISQGAWTSNRTKTVDITTTNGTIVARDTIDADPVIKYWYEKGGNSVAPFLTTSSSETFNHRITSITANGTYWVRARYRDYNGSGSTSWGDYVDNSYTADTYTKITVNVSGSNPYPYTKTMQCTGATFTQSQWKYTFEYWNSSSGMFTNGKSYKFHNNSGYT